MAVPEVVMLSAQQISFDKYILIVKIPIQL